MFLAVFAVVHDKIEKVLTDEASAVTVTHGACLGIPGATETGTAEEVTKRLARTTTTVTKQEGK